MPSEVEEACPFTVAEALFRGTAVLASDVGGIPEIIGPPGEAGILFRKGDIKDLKKKLKYLIDSPSHRQQMGIKGRERAKKYFSMDRMVNQYVSVYDKFDVKMNLGSQVK